MADLSAGSVFAGYRIEGKAGEGGMGVVWRATQLALDRPVALKLIAPALADDAMFRERFKRESQLAASIDHPNVIPIYEAGEAEGRLFLAMRYAPGRDLQTLLREDEPDLARILGLISQVAAALDAAHRQGLVHRDVKPANVLITGEGEDEHAYLTDFGLTKRVAAATGLTRQGDFVGTLDYVAPEQIQGQTVDARADVYALGCMLYYAVTGQRPFARDSDAAILFAHLNDPPPAVTTAISGAPAGLDDVVARALAKNPNDRYPSAGDLARAARGTRGRDADREPERSVARGAAAPGAATVPAAAPAGPTVPHESSPLAEPPAGPGAPTVTDRSPRRIPQIALAGAALIGVGAIAALVLMSGGDDGGGGASTQTQKPPPADPMPRLAATIVVGNKPDGLAADANQVVVANAGDDTISLIDALTNKVVGPPIPGGGNPDSVVSGGAGFWVTATDDNSVRRIVTRPQVAPGGVVDVGQAPEGLGIGTRFVFVANAGSNTVTRINREPVKVAGAPIRVGTDPAGVFVGQDTVWVVNAGDDTVSRLDPSNGRRLGPAVKVGDYPRAVVEADGYAWVTNARDNTVTRIDTDNGRVTGDPIRVGDTPRDIAFGAGRVWVGNSEDDSISQIDSKTAKVVGKPFRVGDMPIGVAYGHGAIWVANQGDNTVMRIDL